MIQIPEELNYKKTLYIKYFSNLDHPLQDGLLKTLCISDFACSQIPQFKFLLENDDCQNKYTLENYMLIANNISLDLPFAIFAREIRKFRNQQFLRLLLREASGLSCCKETMSSWSDFAEVVILHTLKYCELGFVKRYGNAVDENRRPVKLSTISMGKLGGQELNFSSDIDLIFSYTAAGFTIGDESISNQEFFTKIVQQFSKLMQDITVDGFVFRTDFRLRPNGESGSLVMSYIAMETYYQELGRDWERYAMVKARVLDDFNDSHQWLKRLVKSFVYRRYVDFSVIESLRSMKAIIEREIVLHPMLDDIKRGRGGIREVEFIIQCFQLIRGGRLISIQQNNAIKAMTALREELLFNKTRSLQKSYLFLRRLENSIQALNDRQTHTLPDNSTQKLQICMAMGFQSWVELITKLQKSRDIISALFQTVLCVPDAYQDEQRMNSNQLASLWQGHIESGMAINHLSSMGYVEPERCYQMIHGFRNSPRFRRLMQTSRLRLDRFMVLLLSSLSEIPDTSAVLSKVVSLLESIVGRSAYLDLLTENPLVLNELLYWFSQSPFIASLLTTQPFLLEVLIDQDISWRPLTINQLRDELNRKLAQCYEYELQEEALRQFKLINWLLAARAELYGHCYAVRISKFLSDVAEVILDKVLEIACSRISANSIVINKIKNNFAVVAYGKLGSREMNYDSDLDLVFLHEVHPSDERDMQRLTKKIIMMLTTRTQTGILYKVDTRLRPSGSSGLLISHIDAFENYQKTQAWTWEHQAIVRARMLFCSRYLKNRFLSLKREVLRLPRDIAILSYEIQNMRKKINKYLDGQAIKHAAGGLIDLEFLVQYLVLANPCNGLHQVTNTLHQLRLMLKNKVISDLQFIKLKKAYRQFHRVLHQHLLQSSVVNETDIHLSNVSEVSNELGITLI